MVSQSGYTVLSGHPIQTYELGSKFRLTFPSSSLTMYSILSPFLILLILLVGSSSTDDFLSLSLFLRDLFLFLVCPTLGNLSIFLRMELTITTLETPCLIKPYTKNNMSKFGLSRWPVLNEKYYISQLKSTD